MTSKQFWTVLLAWIVFFWLFTGVAPLPDRGGGATAGWRQNVNKHGGITYGRDELLRLSRCNNSAPISVPDEITKRIRKRGRRGGVRARWRRRGSRVSVPAVVCGKVRSIRN
ncbi:hypothetical protein Pcinc_026233 [Petrolisthes cinctipes]|uniref:Secreted protein n=1 Tax=Petrolisthes cinctipes TaxID=88211 RepID=A0AAE1F718_PETCI|nr:hypothetical protein Pcinc_026233 [Petrolisthes cinctipes]